jgi:hypothetical protein
MISTWLSSLSRRTSLLIPCYRVTFLGCRLDSTVKARLSAGGAGVKLNFPDFVPVRGLLTDQSVRKQSHVLLLRPKIKPTSWRPEWVRALQLFTILCAALTHLLEAFSTVSNLWSKERGERCSKSGG